MGEATNTVRGVEWPAHAGRPTPVFAHPWVVAGFAVAIGVAIDALALHRPPGVGVALGLWVVILTAAAIGPLMDLRRPAAVYGFVAAALVLAGFVAVRSSPVLMMLDVGAALALVAVISQVRTADDLSRWTLADYTRHPGSLAVEAVTGAARFVEVDLRSELAPERRTRVRAVATGIVIAFPFVAVFTSLFASADASFQAYLHDTQSRLATDALFLRLLWSLAIAAAVAGFWRAARRSASPTPESILRVPHRRMDPATGATVLACLVALFGLFEITQVLRRYPELVSPSDFSRNARSGFFQLLTVAILVLAVLLLFDWLTRGDDGRRAVTFDRLAVALIALTAMVMASAMNRMWLYVKEFGLTELRLYTSVFMVWLGFVLGWFIWTVLRNRQSRFAIGLLASGVAVIAGLNLANPDALIVRVNWDRHAAGAEFSEEYVSSLSPDALPVLVDLVTSGDSRLCTVERELARHRTALVSKQQAQGVLGDSWSDLQARRALERLPLDLALGCGD